MLWLLSAVFPPLERLRLAAGLPPLQLHLVGNGWGGGQPEPALASWVAGVSFRLAAAAAAPIVSTSRREGSRSSPSMTMRPAT